MRRENEKVYDPEENKRKKHGIEAEMVEFLVETVEITNTGDILEVNKLAGHAVGLSGGIETLRSLDINKIQSVRDTARYARVYDAGLGKADDLAAKDKKEANKKMNGIRKRIKEISSLEKSGVASAK